MSAQDEPAAKKAREETPTAPAEAAATRTDAPATAAAAADAPTTTPAVAGDPKPPAGGEEAEAESGKGKKRKIAAFLAYVGKGYQGFQRNPGAKTIEDELERAIVKAGGISQDNAGDFTKVQWTRAARTDKGVSAVGQCIALRMVLDPPGVLERINEALPEGFKFFGYKRVTGGFNAKTMCDRRRYEYVIPTLAFDPRRCLPRKEVEAEAALAAEAAEQGIDGAVADGAEPFVFDEAVRARVNKILGNYCGTHNFHNYTIRVDPNDASAMRYIISFECGEPFVIDGVEFVRTTVVGQSFMLHQIRKLIGTMIGVMRGYWTEEDQIFALKTKESCNTPMAPELGLFLCECIYHAYNNRYAESHEPLSLDDYSDAVDAFKTQHIYPHMSATEKSENTMETWVRMLPLRQIRNSYEWARKADGGRAFMSKADKKEAEKKERDGAKRNGRSASPRLVSQRRNPRINRRISSWRVDSSSRAPPSPRVAGVGGAGEGVGEVAAVGSRRVGRGAAADLGAIRGGAARTRSRGAPSVPSMSSTPPSSAINRTTCIIVDYLSTPCELTVTFAPLNARSREICRNQP